MLISETYFAQQESRLYLIPHKVSSIYLVKNLGIQSVETKEEFHCTTENVSFVHMTINTLNLESSHV